MASGQNGYLERYMEDTAKLHRSLVVKFNDAAELMNLGVSSQYGNDAVDKTTPSTWKYYLNLSGKYHPTDEVMQVISIDTHELIDFTRENFEVHTATQAAYAYGTRNYYDLVRRYPKQEFLINGILQPCDIDTAIAAPDGTVLSYDKSLVEVNESSLIQKLEEYFKSAFHRWYNRSFIMSNRYYPATFYTTLLAEALPKILLIRLQACKTSEAHSFHVRMYLASHNQLDRYLPYLSLNQALWLYRNVRYLQRHAGMNKTLDTLISEILTKRGIPLSEYSVRQTTDFQDYLPEVVARAKPLASGSNSTGVEYHSIDLLYDRELELTEGNPDYIGKTFDSDVEKLQTANTSVIQTKVLHSSMVDYSNSVPEPLEVVALREWFAMTRRGLYEVLVSFQSPKDSVGYTLSAGDAFIYMQYVTLMSVGIVIDKVPQYLNYRQKRHPRPTAEDLLSVVDEKFHYLRPVAEAIVLGQPALTPKYSVTAFYEYANQVAEQAYWHWFQISSHEDMDERGYVQNMVNRLYEDVLGSYAASPENMAEWLKSRNLPEYDLNYDQAQVLIRSIFEASTGIQTDSTKILKNIQRALIELVKELSSYSIQITRDVNETAIVPINWPAIRTGNIRNTSDIWSNVDASVLVFETKASGSALEAVEATTDSVTKVSNEVVQTYPIAIDQDEVISIESSGAVSDIAGNITVAVTYNGQNLTVDERTGIPGYTTFNRLSENQRSNLKTIYRN